MLWKRTRNIILDLLQNYLPWTIFLWQIFNPIKNKVEIWVHSVLERKDHIFAHRCLEVKVMPTHINWKHNFAFCGCSVLDVDMCQVSLLYGGKLEQVFSSSLLNWFSSTGELKSLVSPPAGKNRSQSKDLLLRTILDHRLVWVQELKFSPCQVHTISVSLGSDCGTSVSCHTNQTFWMEASLLAQPMKALM